MGYLGCVTPMQLGARAGRVSEPIAHAASATCRAVERCEERWNLLPRLGKHALEIQQSLKWHACTHKRRGGPSTSTAPCASDLVHIVLDIMRH